MTYLIYKMIRDGIASGDAIGHSLGISRVAVNKHIKKLISEGVIIQSSSKVGYKWIDDEKVNKYSLQYHLESKGINIQVICQQCVSTNSALKALAVNSDKDILYAAPEQYCGRGRLNREFSSLEGGAYFSLLINNSNLPLATIMRTVIVSGLAVHDVLQQLGIGSKLKWPNDVYVSDKKVAGILLELITSGEDADKLIIGVGINVYNIIPESLKGIAVRLSDIVDKKIEIAELIASVGKRIYYYIDMLKGNSWEQIKKLYLSNSYTLGKSVESNGVKGIGKGITDEGFLIVESEGKEIKIISGDVNIC